VGRAGEGGKKKEKGGGRELGRAEKQGEEGKGFAFSENNSNTLIQIRIQEFKFEPNNKQ